MNSEDYRMAALVVGLSADWCFSERYADYMREPDASGNFAAYLLQYQLYRLELIDRGYLQDGVSAGSGYTRVTFTPEWDPEQNSDMAALGLLWCVMDEYYVLNNPYVAVSFLVNYQSCPLIGTGTGCLDHLSKIADSNTLLVCDQLIYDLMAQGNLVEKSGRFDYGSFEGSHSDVAYGLPFGMPTDFTHIPVGSTT